MLGEQISNKGPIHIYCSVKFNPHDSHGKGQLGFTTEQSLTSKHKINRVDL